MGYLQGCGGGWTHESACCSAGPDPVDDQVLLITVYCVLCTVYCVMCTVYCVLCIHRLFRLFGSFRLFGIVQAKCRVLTSFMCLQTTFKQPINTVLTCCGVTSRTSVRGASGGRRISEGTIGSPRVNLISLPTVRSHQCLIVSNIKYPLIYLARKNRIQI